MEARLTRAALLAAIVFSVGAGPSFAASCRTTNFIVTAPTHPFARQVAEMAERYRRDEALQWVGYELPRWLHPCPITVHVGPNLGAGGATSFAFDEQRRPFGWRMTIQGSRERILDSVLPHEVLHTIFATHFGQPLPCWANEGACTTVEHAAEKAKYDQGLIQFLTTNRGIAFNRMFAMMEYPTDVLPLYAQGYSVSRFLIGQGGKRKFVQYIGDGIKWNNWTAATKKHYGYESLSELQVTWVNWVAKGSPPIRTRTTPSVVPRTPGEATGRQLLADRRTDPRRAAEPVYRGQGVPAGSASRAQLAPVSGTDWPSGVAKASGSEAARSPGPDASSVAGSWYSRHRDRSLGARRAQETAPLSRSGSSGAARSGPTRDSGSRVPAWMMSRPQPAQGPGQIVIESGPSRLPMHTTAAPPMGRLAPLSPAPRTVPVYPAPTTAYPAPRYYPPPIVPIYSGPSCVGGT